MNHTGCQGQRRQGTATTQEAAATLRHIESRVEPMDEGHSQRREEKRDARPKATKRKGFPLTRATPQGRKHGRSERNQGERGHGGRKQLRRGRRRGTPERLPDDAET